MAWRSAATIIVVLVGSIVGVNIRAEEAIPGSLARRRLGPHSRNDCFMSCRCL